MARQPAKKTVESRLKVLERGIKSLQGNNAGIVAAVRDGFASIEERFVQMETRMEERFVQVESRMEERFVQVETRLDQIYNHMDGFVKLHETLDIEFKVIKEQMKRLEDRVARLENS